MRGLGKRLCIGLVIVNVLWLHYWSCSWLFRRLVAVDQNLCEPLPVIPEGLDSTGVYVLGSCKHREGTLAIDTVYEGSRLRYVFNVYYYTGEPYLLGIPFVFRCEIPEDIDLRDCWLYTSGDDSVGVVIHFSTHCVRCWWEPDTPYGRIVAYVLKRASGWTKRKRLIDSLLHRPVVDKADSVQ